MSKTSFVEVLSKFLFGGWLAIHGFTLIESSHLILYKILDVSQAVFYNADSLK